MRRREAELTDLNHLLSARPADWQQIDLATMQFPAEMLVDYVRVYQRKGQTNVGCDPPGYQTAKYIQRHVDTYSSE